MHRTDDGGFLLYIEPKAEQKSKKGNKQVCKMCKSREAKKQQLCDLCWGDVNA